MYRFKPTFSRYRQMCRPCDDTDVLDLVPVIPPQDLSCAGRPRIYDYHREIAWTMDYRGDNDDVPTLLFVGAGYSLIKKVFMDLFGKQSVLFKGYRLYRDYYLYQRQKKAWVRIAVELKGFDAKMMSLEDLGLIVERNIKKTCLCNIKYIKLNRFLNL